MADFGKLAPSGPDRSTFAERRRYLDASLDALAIHGQVTLVVHDLGSALGFDWECRHPASVRGIAYMEAIVRPLAGSSLAEEPGAVLRGEQLAYCRTQPNQQQARVRGLHFIQEDSPDQIGSGSPPETDMSAHRLGLGFSAVLSPRAKGHSRPRSVVPNRWSTSPRPQAVLPPSPRRQRIEGDGAPSFHRTARSPVLLSRVRLGRAGSACPPRPTARQNRLEYGDP